MQRLTKAEEEIMQIIWQLDRCLVSDICDTLGEPRPPHSSISSIVRILEKKGFVGHKAYGKTYEYFPIVAKTDYGRTTLSKLISDYFGGSAAQLVSSLVREEEIADEELKQLLEKLDKK